MSVWLYLLIAYPFGYLLAFRELLRAQAIENYKREKKYSLSKRHGDKGFAIFASLFWPATLPIAVIISISYLSRIKDGGGYGSKLMPKPPKAIRKEIEAKQHAERCKELELEP